MAFLGRKFTGLEGARSYFQLIGDLLDFENMVFSDYMVDTHARQVSVRGTAKFTWKSTGNAWDEVFMYRLKFDKDKDNNNKITSYEVWADSGAAYLARRSQLTRKVVLITYEFTYSPFSGNGILARSIVKSLLQLGCHVTVWCCKPHEEGSNNNNNNNHLEAPEEISQEEHDRLVVIPLQLDKHHGWRKLDDASAWEYFHFENLENANQVKLGRAVTNSDVVCAVDWTGAHANRSLQTAKSPPLVYMNFRVYSSGMLDDEDERRAWFNDKEREALEGASAIIALSERDRSSLEAIANADTVKDIDILLPPLRGDMQQLAYKSAEDLAIDLPESIAAALKGKKQRALVTCVARLSQEKNVMRFVKFVEQANLEGLIPLLAGASSDEKYAARVKDALRTAAPNAIIVEDSFLSPNALAAVFSRAALNFHPCAYDAYGMTIVEAAACGATPSVVSPHVGATALLLDDATLQVEMYWSDEHVLSAESVQEIVDLLQDSDRLEEMGRKAQKTALEWDEVAYGKKMLEIIARVLE